MLWGVYGIRGLFILFYFLLYPILPLQKKYRFRWSIRIHGRIWIISHWTFWMFFISMMYVIETLNEFFNIYMNHLFLYGLINDFIMNRIIISLIYMVRVVKLLMDFLFLFNMQVLKKVVIYILTKKIFFQFRGWF